MASTLLLWPIVFMCMVISAFVSPLEATTPATPFLNRTSSVSPTQTKPSDLLAMAVEPQEANWKPGFGNSTLELCKCPSIDITHDCVCRAPAGIIQQPDSPPTGLPVEVNYTVDIGEPASVTVYFTKADYKYNEGLCELIVNNRTITDVDDINILTTDTDQPIILYGYIGGYCKYHLTYYAYPPNITVIVESNLTGVLTPPPDDIGPFSYRPNTQILWVLVPEVTVVGYNFTFDYLDLGRPSSAIHGEDQVNATAGDFLLIGTGQSLLGGSDFMFYGQRDEGEFKTYITKGGFGHVFFYATTTAYIATGFNVSYAGEVFVPTTTSAPTTTENPPAPKELNTTTIVSVEGASPNQSLIVNTTDNFQKAIANMSAEYVKLHAIEIKDEIIPSTVEVNRTSTCNPFHCNTVCVSFKFSVAALSPNDTWVFTTEVLNDMLDTPSLRNAFETMGDNCKVCDENPTLSLWYYIPIPVGIVVFALVLSFALWHTGLKHQQEEARLKYEQELADRLDDKRRRSSGDISILGVGGSIASRGSLNSRRFTMPFPKANRGVDDVIGEEDEDTIDTSGFKEYDPDLGRIDPTEFGIPKEFLGDRKDLWDYTNPGFVDDEDDERTVFRKGQSTATAAGTDSEDSDGGAVSFSASVKKNYRRSPASPMLAQAEVHRAEDITMSVLGDSHNGETAL